MYAHREANPFRRVVRVTAAWRPLSWFYARTLHHIDWAVYRKRASHRRIPVIELTPVE